MKSFLGLLFALTIFVLVVGGGGLIWYLSTTSEFSRVESPSPATTAPTHATAPTR